MRSGLWFLLAFGVGCGARLLLGVPLSQPDLTPIEEDRSQSTSVVGGLTRPPGKLVPRSDVSESGSAEEAETRATPQSTDKHVDRIPTLMHVAGPDDEFDVSALSRSPSPYAFGDALRMMYDQYGASLEYFRQYGPLPVRPLGVSPGDYRLWRESHTGPWPAEPLGSAYTRLSAVNKATPHKLTDEGGKFRSWFQVFAYPTATTMEVLAGASTGRKPLSPRMMAMSLAFASGWQFRDLDSATQEALIVLSERYEERFSLLRMDLYRELKPYVDRKLSEGSEEKGVAAVFVGYNAKRVVLLRKGEDSKLDALLGEMEARERAVALEVLELFAQ